MKILIANIFIDKSISRRYILKSVNKYFYPQRKKRKLYTIIAPENDNYSISVFDKRIKVVISDENIDEKLKTKSKLEDFLIKYYSGNKTIGIESTERIILSKNFSIIKTNT